MEKEYKYNNSTVRVIFGTIMQTNAEVIVCSNDSRMTMSGNVAKSIGAKASESISAESRKLTPMALGDVALTSAIGLPQKYIFHAITHEVGPDGNRILDHISDDIQCYIIEHSVKKCFQLMRMLNVSTIAFPTIGTGLADIPFSKVAKCMAKVISKSLLATNKAMVVEVYLYDITNRMSNFDFLPFFEWFASYSLVAKRELEQEVQASYDGSAALDAPAVEILDCSLDTRNAHRVFISYSRKDADTVRGICGILNELKIPYWIDINGIYSGENYKEMIVQAISDADLVLFVSSVNSNKSNHVAKEIGIADKYNRVIIPVKIDNSPFNPKMEYDLNGIDIIDFLQPDEKRVRKLKNAVLAHIAMSNKGTDNYS